MRRPHTEAGLGQSAAPTGTYRERNAEVRDNRLLIVNQQVCRFDVPMDHALAVCVIEGARDRRPRYGPPPPPGG